MYSSLAVSHHLTPLSELEMTGEDLEALEARLGSMTLERTQAVRRLRRPLCRPIRD